MKKNDIIFQSVLGQHWDNLPPVMRKHYANRSHTCDKVVVQGYMDIELSIFARILSPIMRILGVLIPRSGNRIPVTVSFESDESSSSFHLKRTFLFADGERHFHSHMIPVGGSDVIEVMRRGIGWHAMYDFDGTKVLLKHKSYRLYVGRFPIRIPLEWVVGKGSAEEEAVNEDVFRMYMEVRHLVWGRFYAYRGEFRIIEMKIDG